MATKAIITRVALNTKNGRQVILTMSNGDSQFFPELYIQRVLEGAFMEGSRPTVLIGTEVSYDKHPYAIGDKAVDNKGVVVVPNILHTKPGVRNINFTFGEVAGHTTEFDKAKMNATAIASLYKSVGAAFGAVKAPVAVAQVEDEQIADPAGVPAALSSANAA